MNSPSKNTEAGSMHFSRVSSQPRDQTMVSRIADRFFTIWATRETPVQSQFNYLGIRKAQAEYLLKAS